MLVGWGSETEWRAGGRRCYIYKGAGLELRCVVERERERKRERESTGFARGYVTPLSRSGVQHRGGYKYEPRLGGGLQ